jgi:D-arginine dehydrogenase
MLLSPCDAEPHRPAEPEVDPLRKDELARKVADAFGVLGEWRLGPGWACLRTFAKDERFVIGPDPHVRGLYWVAALGGHGMTSAWAVGRLAAQVILGRRSPGPFDPSRF